MSNDLRETASIPPAAYDNEGDVALWMERGFTRREIGTRMKEAVPSLTLYHDPSQPLPCSESLEWPDLKVSGGLDMLQETIERLGINALWPQDSARFDLSTVTAEVHVAGTPDVIALVDDKARFSEWLGAADAYRAEAVEVTGAAGVASEYARRSSEGREVCVKPAIGVYGQGYWHLREQAKATLLNRPEVREIHPEIYMAALALQETERGPQRLLVMDWLPGPEVSIDLLCWRSLPLIHAARTKIDADTQRIQSEHPVLEHAYSVAGRLALHGIVSMQYRLDKTGGWKMLEVNPRPAGGSINSEDAGFGIISAWAKLVAHEVEPEQITQQAGDVTLTTSRIASVKRTLPQ